MTISCNTLAFSKVSSHTIASNENTLITVQNILYTYCAKHLHSNYECVCVCVCVCVRVTGTKNCM